MNVILGAGALGGNAAGIRNVARNVSIGTFSMMNAQSGVVDNVAIGYNAMQGVST